LEFEVMPLPALNRRQCLISGASIAATLVIRLPAWSAETKSLTAADQKKLESLVTKGIDYLQTKGQAEDGSFTKQIGIGVTAMAATALLRHGRSPDDPAVAKALKFLEQNVQPTGGIHLPNGRLKTYETCVAVLCFSTANRAGKYDKLLKNADKFLKELPFDAQEGHEPDSFFYGGAGYGGQGRPDLSNTAFLIDALRSTGNDAEDKAIQQALIFVSRCQNLESPHNTTPFAAKINDGGFYYTPVPGKESDEPEANGGLRSYGAMSYSGLKSMIFAGVKQDDPRVKAVVKWIGTHYDVKSNPGMGSAGLYYYYLTFSKALDAFGKQSIEDFAGKSHDWRSDLIAELAARQRADGSWVNENNQWMEGDANLSSAFALLALSYCTGKSAITESSAVE